MAKKATAPKAKGKAKAAAPAPKKDVQVHGIDDMKNAIWEDLQNNPEVPASAKEVTKTAIKAILQSEQALIMGAVSEGDKVQYIGFGGYEKRERSARKGRNPQTGEEMEIDAKVVPGFRPGAAFKSVVAGE
jgi:DNA-binding protein HU-beta